MLSREALEEGLTKEICDALSADIESRGSASLLVSGGSTPKGLFARLSTSDIDWSKVDITLVDERYVHDEHDDQNGKMVKALLCKEKAAVANYIPLVFDTENAEENLTQARAAVAKIQRPFTVVILGMGGDGHTASLFPESPQLDSGMDLGTSEDLMYTEPVTAPHQRITFTRRALLDSSNLILHCYGDDKKKILDEAMENASYRPYPIQGFLKVEGSPIAIHWTA